MASRVVVIGAETSAGRGFAAEMLRSAREAVAGLGITVMILPRWQEDQVRGATVVLHCADGCVPDYALSRDRSSGLLALLPDTSTTKDMSPELDDFLFCPFSQSEFSMRLLRLVLRKQPSLRLDQLLGESPAFLEALARIRPVALSTAPVLLRGETGTGKELFARAIHYNGCRQSGPFVPVNCSAIPEQLFENEIFGHVKGAFTDARTAEKGLLAEANGGTLFLDEVDMLATSSQAKLLRFLQDREFRPLGSTKTVTADVRIIAATNANLSELVAQRIFREDLYHRLNVLPLTIPPLRERIADIPMLAVHFAARFAAQYGRPPIHFAPDAVNKMMFYAWPGNVRELESVVHRAIVFSSSSTLPASALEMACPPTLPPESGQGKCKDDAMLGFERGYLISLLADHRGNLSRCADASGKDRRTLQRLLLKHGIKRSLFCAAG